jgi:hypothetical protein
MAMHTVTTRHVVPFHFHETFTFRRLRIRFGISLVRTYRDRRGQLSPRDTERDG